MSREDDHIVGALVELSKRLGVKMLIQVGAEDGWEAERIREATGCRAIAIDADPKAAPCSTRIEFYDTLIGATDADATPFYVHKDLGLSSQIIRLDGREELRVMPIKRLDTFCRELGVTPDALIIDTEGTTLDVLQGCGDLIDGLKMVYAEVQTQEIRPGIRLLPEVDALLTKGGMIPHQGAPSYNAGAQGNYTWVRK